MKESSEDTAVRDFLFCSLEQLSLLSGTFDIYMLSYIVMIRTNFSFLIVKIEVLGRGDLV